MEKTAGRTAAITFAVDDVTAAEKLLPECPAHEAVKRMLGGAIESCGDYHSNVVKDVDYQSLLAAVYLAFSQHRPLVLTPDAVWVTIAQGIAHHMAIHGERLRSRFVSHAGKLELEYAVAGWVAGSPENPWPEAFAAWTGQIRQHVGAQTHDLLVCDFSTTGPIERTVSQIVMMDIFERYFHYVLVGICGIPMVTLEGTTADWERLREKVRGLRVFDIDWWLEHLLPICDRFVAATRGEVDVEHWQGICKLREEYGGDIINGWVCKLFPYLREFVDGPCRRRNPIFETGQGMQTLVAPPGLSRVPFTWRDAETRRERKMEAIGGLVGVTQDPQTMALRPRVGWAVRAAEKMEVLLARLAAEHPAGVRAGADMRSLSGRDSSHMEPDLGAFYACTNGAELFGRDGTAAYQIVSMDSILPAPVDLLAPKQPDPCEWRPIARLADGSWLAANSHARNPSGMFDRTFLPVCHVARSPDSWPWPKAAVTGAECVVALSFTELLERMLDSGGRWFWNEAGFAGHGNVERYMWPTPTKKRK